ncbi:MAG: endolytic transglycosylase MltG [Lentimicrobiaceae bacterium]|jgi:UPF0755 protein|nr:endolytic transglycosylase MltG [Lentimicrobiaceae bacterium]
MAYYYSRKRILDAKKKRIRSIIFTIFFVLIVVAMAGGYLLYRVLFHPNVWTPNDKEVSVFIPTGSDFEDVKHILYTHGLIIHRNNFEWVAAKKSYPSNIKAGHYILKNGLSNNDLINILRSGNQQPVKVIFNNLRNIEQLAGVVSKQIEADSAAIVQLLQDADFVNQIGFDKETIMALFLPNTYEFYWTTDANGFVSRMLQEYHRFWTTSRKEKAVEKKLTPIEVSILASIVDRETSKTDEMARIAGVYLNRLKSGWYLQADPTLIFAANDYEIRRVLDVHKNIESPYNTYKYTGLPPGPIGIPSIAAMNAVLNAENHTYYFFCAHEDLNGYHSFATTNAQHEQNARKYRRALDRLNIKK